MNGATQAPSPGTLPAMTYRLEFKAADWPDPAVPEDALPAPTEHDPNAPAPWSGDLYEDTPSDPVAAFAAFTGDEGVTAWLDAAPDGTLTGWVQDGDDVYHYTDPAAWALDVDGAQMERAGELGDEEDPAFDAEADAEAQAADGADDPDAEVEDAEVAPDAEAEAEVPAEQVDDTTGHDPNGDTPKVPGDGAQPETAAEVEQKDPEEHDPRDDQFFTRKKKLEGKALVIAVRPA